MSQKESNRYRLKPHEIVALKKMREAETRNVLVIGDLHEPFCLDGYLDFCIEQYYAYNCTEVVFIGDVIDNHYSSYHEASADGMGGLDELELAIKKIGRWRDAFPMATVIIGNHDRIIMRKAQTSSIPSHWIKNYNDVLGTPNWKWVTDVVIDDVRYVHGHKSSKARTAAKRDMQSTVTGHYHTDMYCEWMFGAHKSVFALAVGCGIDSKSYAMGYMQGGKKEAVGCGVVLDNGKTPICVKMDL